MHPWQPDRTFNRNIPVSVIARPQPVRIKVNLGRVVFLNQPLYREKIQNELDYASGLKKILISLSAGYSEVLFKFHPREPLEARNKIASEILNYFPNLRIINENEPFEKLISNIRPEAVASYNSTPLLNLTGTGIQPLFVYHLLPDLRKAQSFAAMHELLIAWEYKFASNWSELASGYHAGEKFDDHFEGQRLAKVINNNIF